MFLMKMLKLKGIKYNIFTIKEKKLLLKLVSYCIIILVSDDKDKRLNFSI